MRIAGTAQLQAPPEVVYDSLQDGRVLAATIPGVQSLEQISDNHYKLSITAGVASIKGTYDGEVVLSQQNRPESFVMTASGAGAPGTVKADVAVRLEERDGGTVLTYDADAVVGGMVGGVGQRMITGVAKKMAGVFFDGIDGVIANGLPAAPSAPEAAAVASTNGTEVAEGAGVRTTALPVATAAAAPAPTGTPSATTVLLSAGVGAGIALAGVALGAILARR